MLVPILVFILVFLLVFGFFVSKRPNTFEVERSITIPASPEAIYPHVNDFHQWQDWSPWAKMDPSMKITYSGPNSGVGAQYEWVGNKKVGEGRMTITESAPPQKLEISLEFIKPIAANNMTIFTFTPQGAETVVRWRMRGTNNFASKLFQLVMNMDKMVGGDFERGLSALKTAVGSGT